MERRVTPPRRVTSPTWGPPPPGKQALRDQGTATQLQHNFQRGTHCRNIQTRPYIFFESIFYDMFARYA